MGGITVTLERRGDAYIIELPKELVEEEGMREGDQIELTQTPNAMLVRRLPRYKLAEQLEGMTPKNSHGEIDWGRPVGNEVW
ncbi:hypothetical protein BH11ARM2_BH11ARM2_28250 [soil metagenome]